MRRKKLYWVFLSVIAISLTFSAMGLSQVDKKQGVYEYVLTDIKSGFNETSRALESAFTASGMKFLSSVDMKADDDCSFQSRVFVVIDSVYARSLLTINPGTAPFAIVDRVNLFNDETGLHISIVNPLNINRTVLMDDQKYLDLSDAHRSQLRQVISGAVKGTTSSRQYGEMRKKGYIGRTMGVMAGGPFDEKIEDLFVIKNGDFPELIGRLENGLTGQGPKWGIRSLYVAQPADYNLAIFGLSGPQMESRSFDIVKEGSDDSREDFTCPGLAHAGAYPLELVVVKDGNDVKIQLVDAMYRMKMYFEDAGMISFAKNMTMPGSIADEIKAMIKAALE